MNKKDLFKKISKESILTFGSLLLVIIIGVYLRIGGILSNSFAFTYDVGRDLLKVQDIVVRGDMPLIGQTTGLGGLYYGPWWYYILTPAFFITGGNPQGIAFFMMLIGILTIIGAYVLGRSVGGKLLGIIYAAFVGFSNIFISYSTQIWNPHLAPFFAFFILIATVKSLSSKKKFLWYFLIGLIMGLVIDSEILFGLLFSIGVFISLLFLEVKKTFLKKIPGLFLGILMIISPRIVFELRHNFIMTKTIFGGGTESNEGLVSFGGMFHVLPERIKEFSYLFADTLTNENQMLVYLLIAFSFCVIVFTRKQISKQLSQLLWTSLIIIITFFIGTSIFERPLWGHYIVGLPVIFVIFVGCAFYLTAKRNKYIGGALLVIYLLFLLNPIKIINDYKYSNWEGNAAVYRNQLAALDYVYKDASGSAFNYTVYTPSVHDYPYRYLFSWYGIKKYGYAPSLDTKNLLYVILEPDPGFEGRRQDWLKIREGDGKVVKESLVKGGIVVQKRMR